MSAHDLVFCNPPLDHNRPASGVVFTNVTPLPITVAISLELTRDPARPSARAVFRGLHVTTPNREHVVQLQGPATALRTVVVLLAPAMGTVTLEAAEPGTVVVARVLSIAGYDT